VCHLRGGALVPNLPQMVPNGAFVAADDENDTSSQSGRCWSVRFHRKREVRTPVFVFTVCFRERALRAHGDPVTTACAGGQDSLHLDQSEHG